MSVLSEILATKRSEVAWQRKKVPLSLLQEQLIDAPSVRDFGAALRRARSEHCMALIAEVKKASPSKGIIRADFDPVVIATTLAAAGATCLSVLTDEPYFQGKLEYLRDIRNAVEIPLLRKDFIIDPWQVVESRIAGADAILLIVAALPCDDLRQCLQLTRECGMTALVEVHDVGELKEALDAGADLIGINNRDLHTFRSSLSVTIDIMNQFPPTDRGGTLFVSESGISTRNDVTQLMKHSVDAILVGESLMREADLAAKVRELLGTS